MTTTKPMKLLKLLIASLLVVGCVNVTVQQKAVFEETQLAPDQFLLRLTSGHFPYQQGLDFALLHSAKLASNANYPFFAIFTRQSNSAYMPGNKFSPRTPFVVHCYKEQPANVYTFDAVFLRGSLGEKYKNSEMP